MSASKKTTKSSSPAPASKLATATKKTAEAATVRTTAKTPVAMLAPSPAPVAKTAPAAVAKKAVKTTITARVDVGFGNALFLRGEGPGLSWEKGLAMTNVGADLWQVTLEQSARSYAFKFLVNDTTWSAGPDFTAACGTSVTLTPEF
jgi:hypothetical protein